MNKREYNQLQKEAEDYYNSYRDIFLRSRRKATLFRFISATQLTPFELVKGSFVPIIPFFIWGINVFFNVNILTRPVRIEGLDFVSI